MSITDAWERIRQYLLKYKPISDEDKQDCHWFPSSVIFATTDFWRPVMKRRFCANKKGTFKHLHVSVWWDVGILRDDVLWRVRSMIQRWHLIPVSGTKMTTCIARLPTLTGCGQRITKRLAEVTALSPRSPSLIFPGLD